MDKDSYYYYQLGNECFEHKEIDNAIKNFLKSLDLDYHFKTYEQLYYCYIHLGEIDLANYFIRMAYENNNNNDKVAYQYSMVLIEKKELNKAKKILESIIQRNPSYKKAKEEHLKICSMIQEEI